MITGENSSEGEITVTYSEWYTLYMSTYKASLKPRTREEYDRQNEKYVLPFIGEKPLEDISPEEIQQILNAASEKGERIAQAVYSLLHPVFSRAVRSRRLQWSPIDAVDRPKHKQKLGKALTESDYETALPFVLENLGLSLALLAGLRRSEICGLQWRDINLAHGVIHVRRIRHRVKGQLITGEPKSESGIRDIPITADLAVILRRAYRLAPSSFCIVTAPERLDRQWKAIEQNAQLSQSYRLHDLRHTYITNALFSGIMPKVVQYLAGHSTIDITMQVYAHVSAERAKQEVLRTIALH